MRTSSLLAWPQEGSIMSSPVVSSRATIRRANKPLLEKRRRARINASLNQLKMLVLETLQKDSARYSKLEKADILEMTVVHLKALRHQQKSVHPHRLVTQYGAGYKECASEIRRYFDTVGCPDVTLLSRLETHLATCVRKVDQVAADISLSLNQKDPSLSPPSSHHHQHPLLLVPSNHLYPVQLPSDVTVLGSEREDRKCVESDGGADRSLSSLLSYLGVSSAPRAPRNPGRQRKIEQVLDENENVSGREDLENARHLYVAAMDRFNAVRSADTVRDLLLKSFDMGGVGRGVRPGSEALNEPVWRPW